MNDTLYHVIVVANGEWYKARYNRQMTIQECHEEMFPGQRCKIIWKELPHHTNPADLQDDYAMFISGEIDSFYMSESMSGIAFAWGIDQDGLKMADKCRMEEYENAIDETCPPHPFEDKE